RLRRARLATWPIELPRRRARSTTSEASTLSFMRCFQAAVVTHFLCPRITSCDGPAAMRTRYDQLGKQMIRDALDGGWFIETDAEVPADTRRIDLWVTPHEAGASWPEHLGLLGRITSGSVTLEFFHNTPSGDELHICLLKHGEFRHFLSRRKTLPPLPIQ